MRKRVTRKRKEKETDRRRRKQRKNHLSADDVDPSCLFLFSLINRLTTSNQQDKHFFTHQFEKKDMKKIIKYMINFNFVRMKKKWFNYWLRWWKTKWKPDEIINFRFVSLHWIILILMFLFNNQTTAKKIELQKNVIFELPEFLIQQHKVVFIWHLISHSIFIRIIINLTI